ncbi:hypothetical protein JCGZ_24945 [Jatropha curcas]|uniref:Uncharacterized protein n=1 Tax=Jatropha curcas TaxID=180498 RepID=A0A067KXK7_JATCU|nr:hypothetical protein JCGZ_24945 [Jatropha curcas]
MAITARSAIRITHRLFSSTSNISHHNSHKNNHTFLEPNYFIGSWEAPKNPKEAEKKLARLRIKYAKQVKEVRKWYIKEMELMRVEKQRKDEAKKEAIRVANEERKKLKAEAAKVRAEERKIADEEFRRMLLKERGEKLDNWRMKETAREEKKKEKNKILHQRSSLFVDESELESRILKAIQDVSTL